MIAAGGYGAYPGLLGHALPVLGVLLIAALAAHEAVFITRHALRCKDNKIGDRCTCPVSHRFLSGRPFHGVRNTDATFWRAADKDDGHVSPFQRRPRVVRRLLRTGPVLAVCGALISWPLTVAAVGLVGAAWALRRYRRRLSVPVRLAALALRVTPPFLRERIERRHGSRRQDMAQALATITGNSSIAVKPRIDWNPAYASAEPGAWVATWYLPRGFKASSKEKAQVEDLWRGRVGFDLVPDWRTHDARPAVVLTRARELPALVYLAEVMAKLERLDDSKTAIGIDDQGELVTWDWSSEYPHGVINAGSRHGKTELNKCMIGQILRKGGGVTYVDPKEISIQGMEGVPGLTLLNDPADIPAMWEGIARFRELMDERRKERAADPTAVSGWSRQVLFLEEVNQFSEQSDDLWEDLPEEDPDTFNTEMWKPKRGKRTPRVWRHIKAIAWQGAAFKMHLVVDGQDVQATVLKGVRNSLGMRLLGGYLPQQWKYLVGTTPIPPAPPQKGRWCLVNGAEQTWVQAVIADLNPDESSMIWRDYARDGRRMDGSRPPVTTGVTDGPVTPHGNQTWQVSGDGTVSAAEPCTAVTDPRGVKVSLTEAVDRDMVPGASKRALEMDRHRSDKGELPEGLVFPEVADKVGQTERFWSAELIEFNRLRRGVAA